MSRSQAAVLSCGNSSLMPRSWVPCKGIALLKPSCQPHRHEWRQVSEPSKAILDPRNHALMIPVGTITQRALANTGGKPHLHAKPRETSKFDPVVGIHSCSGDVHQRRSTFDECAVHKTAARMHSRRPRSTPRWHNVLDRSDIRPTFGLRRGRRGISFHTIVFVSLRDLSLVSRIAQQPVS